jgi:two-component system KDP operon response regulator KdpE
MDTTRDMKILVVDDDPDVVEAIALSFGLQWPESTIVAAQTGQAALQLFARERPDVVLLDIGLPDMDGFEVTRHIRERSDVPILMISARIRAVLRRMQSPAPMAGGGVFRSGPLVVNYATHEVLLRGKPIKLTPIEYKLLYQLTRNTGQVLLHDQLLTRVWGPEYRGELDYLRIYVRRLREKLEDTPQAPTRIVTERGTGYRFVQEPPAE